MNYLFSKPGDFHVEVDDIVDLYDPADYLLMPAYPTDVETQLSRAVDPVQTQTIGAKTFTVGEWYTRELTEEEEKLKGFEFEGVWCSATEKDQNGLGATRPVVKEYGQSIYFKFQNGNRLLITPTNQAAFEVAFIQFRASFFPIPT